MGMTAVDDPIISVIIPHLNQLENLESCLRSLAIQLFDMSRADIVVVDNGSKELPRSVCASFSGVRLLEEETPGPGPARNRGIGASRADILAFIDADCVAEPHWLSTIVEAFKNPATQVIGGDVQINVANPTRPTMLEAYESIFAYRQREYIERMGFSGTGNLAMRRGVYYGVGPFAGIDVAEDREWGQRATALGYHIRYESAMVVYHPARKTLSELCVKWDRHIAHDYAVQFAGWTGRSRWMLKALALAASPIWESVRIFRSRRIATFRARLLALWVLTRIRLHRSGRMVSLMRRNSGAAGSASWNRSG